MAEMSITHLVFIKLTGSHSSIFVEDMAYLCNYVFKDDKGALVLMFFPTGAQIIYASIAPYM